MKFVLGVGIGVITTASMLAWRNRSRSDEEVESVPPRVEGVRVSRADLLRLRGEPRFPALLILCRISNSLRFAHTAPLEIHDEGTPRAARQLNNAFLFQVAVAIEALDTLKGLGQHLHQQPAWSAEITPLFRDKEIQKLETETVRNLRNQIVFHFDREAIETGLAQMRESDATFVAGHDREVKDVYFPLADEAAVAYLVPTWGLEYPEYRERVGEWIRRATVLSLQIADAVEKVATEIASDLGLDAKQ